jgi:hypothetical protein
VPGSWTSCYFCLEKWWQLFLKKPSNSEYSIKQARKSKFLTSSDDERIFTK